MSYPRLSVKDIEEVMRAKMAEPPAQILSDNNYQPIPQDYYMYADDEWQRSTTLAKIHSHRAQGYETSKLQLFSWNIDVLVPFWEARMAAAINHLEQLISNVPPTIPVVIFLQEMASSDVEQLKATKWIRQRFYMTDVDNSNWKSPMYGTVMLIDNRLSIASVFRVPWVTKFERDGLFVDIAHVKEDRQLLRLCNTHLESLVADPPVRPLQLAAAANYMKAEHVYASILAGDLNAIQPFDRTMVTENGLRDTFLELGGQDDTEEGYTWGQQVPQWMKKKFGCSRMDKVLLCGSVTAKSFRTFGLGVKVEDEAVENEMKVAGQLEWVSDHLGIIAELELPKEHSVL